MPRIAVFRGEQVIAYLADVARLRIAVFRDFPYLYDGDEAFETKYLRAYAESPDSVFVLAFEGGEVIGASTGIPLAQDGEAFQRPFRERGVDVGEVFYFGESVLLTPYRGLGVGHRFFDEREAHARRLGGFAMTAFCAVDRAPEDARRPSGYRPNDVFWRKRGYERQDGMRMRLAWRELGETDESEKTLTFWQRKLEPA
ncbi:MAG: GNAT family N-acetyltransferase [Arenimonas sp.]